MITVDVGPAALRAATKRLALGDVIAFPTETTYGLGCDPRNAASVRRLFRIKGRPDKKPVLLVAASLTDVRRVAELNPIAARIAAKHWPGALTLVLPQKRGVKLPPSVAPKGQVAIRVSSSPLVQTLVRAYKFPIIATSANQSGKPPATSARSVRTAFRNSKDAPDFILNSGALPRRKPSTVARINKDGRIEILRQGAVHLRNT